MEAIGHKPNIEIFKGQVELDREGCVVSKEMTKTSVEGVLWQETRRISIIDKPSRQPEQANYKGKIKCSRCRSEVEVEIKNGKVVSTRRS